MTYLIRGLCSSGFIVSITRSGANQRQEADEINNRFSNADHALGDE